MRQIILILLVYSIHTAWSCSPGCSASSCSCPSMQRNVVKCCDTSCEKKCCKCEDMKTTVPDRVISTPLPPSKPSNSSSSSSSNMNANASIEVNVPVNISNLINLRNEIKVPVNVSSTNINTIHVVIKKQETQYITRTQAPTTSTAPTSTPTTSTTTTTPCPTTPCTTPTSPPEKCCKVVQPCIQQPCKYPKEICGAECVQPVIYKPYNPCEHVKCVKQQYSIKRVCTPSTGCNSVAQSCSGCNSGWHNTYQGHRQCSGCYRVGK